MVVSIHGYRAHWGCITRYIVLFIIWKDTLESSGAILVNTLYGPAGPCYTLQCRSPTWRNHNSLAHGGFNNPSVFGHYIGHANVPFLHPLDVH